MASENEMGYVTQAEHAEFARRLAEQKSRTDKRLELIDEKLENLTTLTIEVKSLAQSVESMAESLRRQNERITVIEHKDGELWRAMVKYAVTAIVGVMVGYISVKLGLA